MRARNSVTGKYERIKIGQAVCGRRFSNITITAEDMREVRVSELSSKAALKWFEHIIFTRLG